MTIPSRKISPLGAFVKTKLGAFDTTRPVIDSADTPFSDGATGKKINGDYFLDNAGKVELTDSSDYKNASTKVEQTVTAWSDKEITITVDKGGLPDTAYLWVFEENGYRNRQSFEVSFATETRTASVSCFSGNNPCFGGTRQFRISGDDLPTFAVSATFTGQTSGETITFSDFLSPETRGSCSDGGCRKSRSTDPNLFTHSCADSSGLGNWTCGETADVVLTY